ncbi:MAG: hypothetical protein LBU80_00560, partial [Rikenellaceae bacterium]|nr:hypothetical protein [Rikenellaceae bacterium]
LAYAYDCPKVTAEAGIRYNYREKLYLGVTGTLMGSRYGAYAANVNDFSYLTENKLNAAFDLRVNADYFITRQVGVFAEAGNILNQKLYPFNHYPGLGVNFMAGVKLSF